MSIDVQTEVASRLRVTQILATSFLMTVVVIALVAHIVPMDGKPSGVLPLGMGLMGILVLFASELLSKVLPPVPADADLKSHLNRNFLKFLLTNVFREAAAILALVIALLAPSEIAMSYVLWTLSLALMLFRFPNYQNFTQNIPPELLR